MTKASHVPLTTEDRDHIERARDWIKGHFEDEPDECYLPLEGKLRVIDAILENRWVQPNETWKLQTLGIALGDALAQKLQMTWVTVQDEYGCDPALKWPGQLLYCYPMTMISKRVESEEDIDVRELFEGMCDMLTEMGSSGRFDRSIDAKVKD